MIEGQPGVIQATASNLAGLVPIITDPGPLRDRNLIALDPRKLVDGLDIILAGQPFDRPTKIRRLGIGWKLYGGPNDPTDAYAAPIERLVDAITARRSIKDFPAPTLPSRFTG